MALVKRTECDNVVALCTADPQGLSKLKARYSIILGKYHDSDTDRYIIPAEVVDSSEQITTAVLNLASKGYVLTRLKGNSESDDVDVDNGFGSADEDRYMLYSIEKDTKVCRAVTVQTHDLLARLLSPMPYTASVSIDTYGSNLKVQEVIDKVLVESSFLSNITSDGWSIGVIVSNGKFIFIECLDACR